MKKLTVISTMMLTLCIPTLAFASSGGGEEGMMTGILAILASMLVMTGLAKRFGFPPILGQIVAGIIVGNVAVGGLKVALNSEFLELFGALGISVLMFEGGLEGDLQEIKKNGKSAIAVAVLGVTMVGALGYGVARVFLPSASGLTFIFVGAALTPTSAGIGASIFRSKQARGAFVTITLVAAVVDDILGLVILAVLDSLGKGAQTGASMEIIPLAVILLKAVSFIVGGLLAGRWLATHFFRNAFRVRHPEMLLPSALTFAFAVSMVGLKMAGLAPLIGAYVAGLVLEKTHYQDLTEEGSGDHQLEHAVKPLRQLMAPVFFFLLGAKVPARALINPSVIALAAALTVACVVGKFTSAFGVRGKDVRKLPVIFGMTPRGEVAAIMVAAGAKVMVDGQPLISQGVFTAFILMILMTTLVSIVGLNKVVGPADAS